MKPFFLSLFLLVGAPFLANAQATFDVPAETVLNKPEDYAKYEPQVISTINWLEATPVNQDVTRRQQAQRFLLQWASGSPRVSIGIESYLSDLYAKNPALLMSFMGGWTRYSLLHPDVKDALTLNAEGVKSMVKVYGLGGVEKNKALEKVRDLAAAGQLEPWLKSKIGSK